MATLARHFLKPAAMSPTLADRRQINTDAPSGAVDTGTSVQYPAAGLGSKQFRPGSSAVTTGVVIPTAGTTPANKWGWRQQVDITPETARTVAGNWPVSARFTVSGASSGPRVIMTYIAYLVSDGVDTTYTEIGRVGVDTGTTWQGGVVAGSLPATEVEGPLNSRIELQVYMAIATAAVSVGAVTYTIYTNSADSFLGPGDYTTSAARSFTTSTSPAATFARGLTAARTQAVTTSPTVTRRSHITTNAKTVTTSPTVTRRSLVTLGAKGVTTTPTVTNRKAVTLKTKGVTTTPTVGMVRLLSALREGAVAASGAASLARAVISARGFSVVATGATKARLDLPAEALNRIITAATPDWPLTEPTKAISGITRGSDGTAVGGCTVLLIRQGDDVRVSSTTSDVTGAYSFTRGGDDPNSYRVLGTKADVPEIHGVSDVLVPA